MRIVQPRRVRGAGGNSHSACRTEVPRGNMSLTLVVQGCETLQLVSHAFVVYACFFKRIRGELRFAGCAPLDDRHAN